MSEVCVQGLCASEQVDAYVIYLRDHHRHASARASRALLHRFLREMEPQGLLEWSDVETLHVEEWVRGCRERGLSPASVVAYTLRLRSFFEWLWKEDLILVNPVSEGLCGNRVPKSTIAVPVETEVAACIDRAEVAHVNEERNWALMELMYSTGIRRGEVVGLNLRDIQGDWIRVMGKGGKERLVPLGDAARDRLREYVAGERTMLAQRYGGNEGALFLSRRGGRRLGALSITVALTRSMRSSVGPHMLRRACATHMLRNGAPVQVLQKLLGHEKLSTTEIYTKVTEADVRREMLRRHPGW